MAQQPAPAPEPRRHQPGTAGPPLEPAAGVGVTGAEPGDRLSVLTATGVRILTAPADEAGQLHVRPIRVGLQGGQQPDVNIIKLNCHLAIDYFVLGSDWQIPRRIRAIMAS